MEANKVPNKDKSKDLQAQDSVAGSLGGCLVGLPGKLGDAECCMSRRQNAGGQPPLNP